MMKWIRYKQTAVGVVENEGMSSIHVYTEWTVVQTYPWLQVTIVVHRKIYFTSRALSDSGIYKTAEQNKQIKSQILNSILR